MVSMSYCKWENTALDLRQCLTAMEEHETDADLSEYEKAGKKRCIDLARRLVELADEDGK